MKSLGLPVGKFLGLLPAFGSLLFLFGLPICLLFAISFWTVKSLRLRPDFTFAAYERSFAVYGGLLANTMLMAAAVAIICTIVGFVFAYGARFRTGVFGDVFILGTMITLFGGYLIKVYSWKAILSSNGAVNSVLMWAGIADEPLTWLIYNRGSVIIALVNFLLPFAILPIYSELRNVQEITLDAARDLGASAWRTTASVVIPQCKVGLVSAFSICFLSAAGDYVTPMFLGGGSGAMMGQLIVDEFANRFNWPNGAAMSFTMMGASFLVIIAVWVAVMRKRR